MRFSTYGTGRETTKDIGVDFGVAARFTSESQEKFQWIECRKPNHAIAQVHGSTRQLPLFSSETSMVGLRNFHGSAFGDAWFRFHASIH